MLAEHLCFDAVVSAIHACEYDQLECCYCHGPLRWAHDALDRPPIMTSTRLGQLCTLLGLCVQLLRLSV